MKEREKINTGELVMVGSKQDVQQKLNELEVESARKQPSKPVTAETEPVAIVHVQAESQQKTSKKRTKSQSIDSLTLEIELQDLIDRVITIKANQTLILQKQDKILSRLDALNNSAFMIPSKIHIPALFLLIPAQTWTFVGCLGLFRNITIIIKLSSRVYTCTCTCSIYSTMYVHVYTITV